MLIEFGVNQGLAQTAGMISGLIYVRFMPIDQYAVYALALSALSFLSVGSDLGLTGAIGYFWRQKIHGRGGVSLDSVILAVRRLRLILVALAGVIAGAMLLKSATAQKLPLGEIFFCFLFVMITGWVQSRISIDLLIVRIEGNLRQSYYCEAAGNAARLLSAVGMIAYGATSALFGLFGGLLGALATASTLHTVARLPKIRGPVKRETWRELIAYIGPILPSMVVHLIQDPLIFWLAFNVGGQAPLSETFALGRIGAIYGVIGSFIITVVATKIARIHDDIRLARMVGLFLVALVFFCGAVLLWAFEAPSVFLVLIGPKYANLHEELLWSLVSASLGLLILFLVIVNRSLGWIRLEPVTAVVQLSAIILLVPIWSFRDSLNTIWLMVVLAAIALLGVSVTTLIGFFAPSFMTSRR